MPWATVADVRARWDGETSDQRIQAALDDAEAVLQQRVPDLASRVTAGTTTAEMLRIVICRAVTRWLDNPRGVLGERAGEVQFYFAARSGTRGAEQTSGRIGFSPADLADLGITRAPAATIRVGLEPHMTQGARP